MKYEEGRGVGEGGGGGVRCQFDHPEETDFKKAQLY